MEGLRDRSEWGRGRENIPRGLSNIQVGYELREFFRTARGTVYEQNWWERGPLVEWRRPERAI